jgi:NAD(P)-dependent dehydrogenase (short-subunit alcohol dehydrogenase family)
MNHYPDFNGQVALVTGAGSGMGLATARAFAQAGAAVALADVNEDAAFNNAGVMAHIAPTADSTREEFERVTGVNLRGVWSCMKHELRHMERQGSGAIVNCSSVGGLTGDPGIAAYIASKHGVIGLTMAAALEYAAKGIRVNAVCPGTIDTAIARAVVQGDDKRFEALSKSSPLGRIGRPEEIASAVLWLCSPGASYVVGHALPVDAVRHVEIKCFDNIYVCLLVAVISAGHSPARIERPSRARRRHCPHRAQIVCVFR